MSKSDMLALLIPASFIGILAISFIYTRPGPTSQIHSVSAESVKTVDPPTTSVPSSDGLKKLVLTTLNDGTPEVSYTLKVQDTTTGQEAEVYRSTLFPGSTIVLPLNSWSNDNSKFFIEIHNSSDIQYLVFNANGSAFKNGSQFLDISDLWQKTKINKKIKTLTGWADKDLIIVYTKNPDGADGPSYWFVVSSRTFLQLNS